MVDRQHITNFLRLNGVSPTSPEDDIAEVLRIARWHEDDIRTALLKLRGEEEKSEQSLSDNPHNLFFTNAPVTPETLTSLLGMDVSIPHAREYALEQRSAREDQLTTLVVLLTILTSVVLGVFATLFIMSIYNIGPFYSPVENFVF